jgi:DNA mismatch repair protein MutL
LAKQAYLVCEGEDGIYILDQHAAHERSLFSELRRSFQAGNVPSQAMLFPETVALTPEESERAEANAGLLARLGLDVRVRSDQSASIHSAPRLLTRVTAEQLLRQLLTDLAHKNASKNTDQILAHLACSEAVKPGERLQRETAESFLRSLAAADFDVPCPHGSVIVSTTTLSELARKSGRGDSGSEKKKS